MSLSYDILNIFFFKHLYIKIRVTKQTSFKCKVFVRLTPCVENSRRCFCVINQADCSMNSTPCILMSSNVIGFSVSQFRLMSLSYYVTAAHSSEIWGLCLMKSSRKTLQNLPYFWNMKTHVVFFVFHFVLLYFFPNECPGLCRHRRRAFIREKIK